MHHEYSTPIGMSAEYAHPIETLFLGLGTILGPILLARDIYTLWFWLVVRLFQTIEAHSGYDLPWSPRHFIPLYAGALHHDHHHKTFTGNYASIFVVWDRIFETDKNYLQHLKKLDKS